MSSCSSADSGNDTDISVPSFDPTTGEELDGGFAIKESCEEIRADYMNAAPGSNEERWALEAAEEACFSQ